MPAESVKTSEATEITPFIVLPLSGVKVALYTDLDTTVQLERDPPEMVTSDVTKSLAASESVKVRVDLSPKLKELSASSSVMAIVGAVVSMTMSLLYASEPLPVIRGG